MRAWSVSLLLAAPAALAQSLGMPSLVAPDGHEDQGTQNFVWTAVASATDYEITFIEVSGIPVFVGTPIPVSAAQAGCASGTGMCAYLNTLPLPTGRYNWFVRAKAGGLAGTAGGPNLFYVGPFFETNFPKDCLFPGSGWTNAPAGSTAGWSVDTAYSVEGACSLKANAIPAGGKARVEFTGLFRAGFVNYSLKVSSATGGGCLRVYRDGVHVPAGDICSDGGGAGYSGDRKWIGGALGVNEGQHTITWSYEKDPLAAPGGFDTAWLDDVQLPLQSLPAVPTVVGPIVPPSPTTIYSHSPTLSWNASPGADSYRVRVYSYQLDFDLTYAPQAVGCASGAGVCSLALPAPYVPLPDNTYLWGVAANSNGTTSPISRWRFDLKTSTVPPGAVDTIAPDGLTAPTPTYSWNAAATAASYTLLVQNTAGVLFSNVYDATAIACSTTCSVQPATPLVAGTSYSWFVRANNSAGSSPWSAPRAISVPWFDPPSLPGISTLIAPIGPTGTATPAFSWTPASSATQYELDVRPATSGTSYLTTVMSTACSTTCTATLPSPLVNGLTYTWTVRGMNSSGYGPASATGTFTIASGPVVPPAPNTISPTGTITTTTPTFSWAGVAGATSYYVLVQNTGGVAISRSVSVVEANCTPVGNICTLNAPVALANGATYNWFVNATNANGTGPWSAPRTITVQVPVPGPPMPTPLAPSGTITSMPWPFAWTASAGANQYRLLIHNASDVEVFGATLTPVQAGCGSGTGNCAYAPPVTLPPGTYTWLIGAADASGPSPFASMQFTVQQVLITPTPTNPFGPMFTATPEYRWVAVAGATSYEILVQNTSGVALNARYTPIEANCNTFCSVTPTTTLQNAAYNWFVRAISPAGTSPWSDPKAFSVSVAAIPLPPTLIAPQGTIASTTPGFQWNASAGATSYFLYITPTGGSETSSAVLAVQAGCESGTGICTAPPFALAPGSYTWYLRAVNSGGQSAASAVMSFTIALPPVLPAAPVTVSPAGTVTTLTPTYTWNAIAGANSYYLLVQNTSGVAVAVSYTAAAAGCGAGFGTCSVTPTAALGNGAVYNWFVNATNSIGTGPWSSATTITVSAASPGAPAPPSALYLPSVTTDTLTPRYLWSASPGATSYELIVQNTSGVAANLTVTSEVAHCPSGSCDITPPGALTNGATYNWFVRATNGFGTSAWSAPNTFTVTALGPGPPAAPVLMGPSGVSSSATPLFVWEEVSGATGYSIVVQNTAGVVFYQTLGTATCLASFPTATCAAQPSAPLPSGTYNWFVNARNSYGTGPWSSARTITIP